jgi:hypothetical protein
VFHAKDDIELQVPEDGVLNFSSFFVDPGATVTFSMREGVPVVLSAGERIIINGTIKIRGLSDSLENDSRDQEPQVTLLSNDRQLAMGDSHGSGLRVLAGRVTAGRQNVAPSAGGLIFATMTPEISLIGSESDPVDLNSAIQIESQPVPNPIPGGVWLLGSAFVAGVALFRKKPKE